MTIAASYFDGKSSRRHRVTLHVEDEIARIQGDAERRCPLAQLRVSEATRHGASMVTFPDGAYLEVDDAAAFATLLSDTGHVDGIVARLQQSWRAALLATLALVLLLAVGWRYLLPPLTAAAAAAIPPAVEQSLGERMLAFLDDRLMRPSKLPAERQEAIHERFLRMLPDDTVAPPALLFRASRIGPNALALPGARIVLTDELAQLLKDDDDALMAVLAHEAGHLRRRHLMRRLVHDSATGAAMTALFGDASGLFAALPAMMLDTRYSRDVEREADDEAAMLLRSNGLASSKLADALEKLSAGRKEPPPWLATHPPTPERIARLRGSPD
ncbi:M48 family metallopeptidase [Noviherbaspirillum pedocola]|uniref:M48 family metallopeptidase n=1 Tax=Noviherbaspirillum pedocola TaxID=2801341 RepID=A0A934SW58_9BURK|nr:M48 family metallopeptidase [Noviherbaspirillum pedocola]MBK4736867.1 M48 family metallopeptidase [Noviherbaspirillum pedocola]